MNLIEIIKPEDQIPEIGDLAYNEDGALGVITGRVTGSLDSGPGFARSKAVKMTYAGVHVSNDHAPKGSPWKSTNPRVVGCVSNAEAFVSSLNE